MALPYSQLKTTCSICDPAKIFLKSKFSYLLLSNPTHQTKTGTVNQWIFFWRYPFLEREYSVTNSLFLRENIRQKATENWFFGMVSPHLCLLATVFRVPWNKTGSRRSYLLHSCVAGFRLCCAYHQPHPIVPKMEGQNYFADPNWHVLTRSILICRVHKLASLELL
jgi:hypothetical protein